MQLSNEESKGDVSMNVDEFDPVNDALVTQFSLMNIGEHSKPSVEHSPAMTIKPKKMKTSTVGSTNTSVASEISQKETAKKQQKPDQEDEYKWQCPVCKDKFKINRHAKCGKVQMIRL